MRHKYNGISQIWDSSDRWHARVHREISAAVVRLNRLYTSPHDVLVDIGSGGLRYNVAHKTYLQFDIADERLRGIPMAACADAHALPLPANYADCVLCVGPVANYCSLIDLLVELGRIAKAQAALVLHVELSNSLEFLGTRHFRAASTFASTFYNGEEKLWLYSNALVRQALNQAGFSIRDARYFHIASALSYRLIGNANTAAVFSALDVVLRWMPGIGGLADSAIFICEKSA